MPAPEPKRRCARCTGLFPQDSGLFKTGKPWRDSYCKGCKVQLVMESADKEKRREAKARYIERIGGREVYNRMQLHRKRHGSCTLDDIQVR